MTRIWFLLLIPILLAGCSTVDVPPRSIHGTYTPVATEGSAHFWEGDVVTINSNGYRHSKFTDELGPWIEKRPYAEYQGKTVVTGNLIEFVDSWLEPSKRVFVQVGTVRYLLTPDEYESFRVTGQLPEYALAAESE